mmetsp:Transcript_84799/g.213813  ORF Transcript_84799/g.213813 Transcript_84799/m.213813 type:complete len:210 (+) Transcript_84799:457-1086(+)
MLGDLGLVPLLLGALGLLVLAHLSDQPVLYFHPHGEEQLNECLPNDLQLPKPPLDQHNVPPEVPQGAAQCRHLLVEGVRLNEALHDRVSCAEYCRPHHAGVRAQRDTQLQRVPVKVVPPLLDAVPHPESVQHTSCAHLLLHKLMCVSELLEVDARSQGEGDKRQSLQPPLLPIDAVLALLILDLFELPEALALLTSVEPCAPALLVFRV